MYYGLNDVGCDATNNNIDTKNGYLKDIIDYVKPDIFTVNEIYADKNAQDYLLNNVFLENGYSTFKRAKVYGSYLTQQVFYNSSKVELKSSYYIDGYPREAHVYKFYYQSQELSKGDTLFFNCIVVHLKAGGTSSDASNRATETKNIMSYIAQNTNENFILMGDFNVYNSTETCFQNLISPSNSDIKFNDPINKVGSWHNNSSYTQIHTQSTNYYGTDCAVGGGLDDRFDFFLVGNSLLDNTNSIHYVENSYKAIGNDGKHFNDAIDYQGNSSVPANILTALAHNSDHLPINIKFYIDQNPKITSIRNNTFSKLKINNPVNNTLQLTLFSDKFINENIKFTIYNSIGKKVAEKSLQTYSKILDYNINVSNLKTGLYFIKAENTKNNWITQKFIKN